MRGSIPPLGRAVVVGRGAAIAEIRRLVTTSDRLLFLDLAQQVEVSDALGLTGEVISTDGVIGDIEEVAWKVAHSALVGKGSTPGLSDLHMKLAVRTLTTSLVPVVRERAEAAAVLGALRDATEAVLLGLADPQTSWLTARTTTHLEVVAGAAASGEPLRAAKTLMRVVAGMAQSLRRPRLRRPAGRLLAFFPAHPVHQKITQSAIDELMARGWRLALVDVSDGGGLRDPRADVTVRMADFGRGTELRRVWDFARLRLSKHRVVPPSLLSSYALEPWGEIIENRARSILYFSSVPAVRGTGLVLKSLRPDASLVVSETGIFVEAAALMSSRPVVNVQHGVLLPSPLLREMPYTGFCVFGSAYSEVLKALGNDPSRIFVVGDPRLDQISSFDLPVRRRDEAPTLLFAAQYDSWRSSSATNEAALAALLKALHTVGHARLIVKLHPAGEGLEFGYEQALRKFPYDSVEVTREAKLYELIAESDLVVIQYSTVGFEAAAFRKPLLVVNLTGAPDEVPFVHAGVGVPASTMAQVIDRVRQFLRGEFPVPADEVYERFNRDYHDRLDGRAFMRIADVVDELSSGSGR